MVKIKNCINTEKSNDDKDKDGLLETAGSFTINGEEITRIIKAEAKVIENESSRILSASPTPTVDYNEDQPDVKPLLPLPTEKPQTPPPRKSKRVAERLANDRVNS